MAVTYNANVQITRSTQFDRMEFRKLALTSGRYANEEFAASFDLTDEPYPQFPIAIVTPNIATIKFVVIQVTGGKALVRLAKTLPYHSEIDLEIDGTIILSGVDLSRILILNQVEPCYIEVYGMGT